VSRRRGGFSHDENPGVGTIDWDFYGKKKNKLTKGYYPVKKTKN